MTIRARLTLWYGLIVLAVLAVAGASVLWLHGQQGLARVDERLEAAIVSVTGVIRNELDEGLDLRRAAGDMMAELTLSGEAVAVLGAEGVAGRQLGRQTDLPDDVLEASTAAPHTVGGEPAGVRILGVPFTHRAQTFRIVVWTSLGPLQAERLNLQRAMLLGIPLAASLAVAAGFAIGGRALRPLEAMVGQTAAIDGRSPSARLTGFNPHDELGTLGRGFNALLDRVAASLQQQRSFMADASHQLRTPVSVVRTAAQVMLTREGRSEEEYRDSLDVIARQAQKLTRMVDDMFTLALADADARPLQPAPLYLDELVDEAAEDVRTLAVAKDIRLDTELAGETPFVGDEHLLRQMLTNLLENAVRHTPAEGTVTVSLTRASDGVRLVVADTGPGIDSAETERVFNRFVRLDTADREAGGGLGLPIARWIAEAHGGTLVLAATGPQGSRFEVALPHASIA